MADFLTTKLAELQATTNNLERRLSILETQDKVGNFTAGSVLFADTDGSVTQDNTNLYWDDTNDRLGVGTTAPVRTLTVSGIARATSAVESVGTSAGLVFQDRSGSNNWQWYGTGDVARLYTGSKDTINIDDNGTLNVVVTDAVTNTVTIGVSQWHRSTGTVAASFGLVDRHVLESDNGTDREASRLQTTWVSAVDASRKARTSFLVFDTAQREILRGEASGTAPMIGFLGTAASAKLTVTGSRGGNAALASLLTQLATYGLITDSSSA